MCNSSFIINNSILFIIEDVSWFCRCQEHFGPVVFVFTSVLCFIVGMPIHCWSLWVFLRGNFKPNMVFPLNIIILELIFCIQCIADFIDFKYSTTVSYSLSNFLIGLSWTFRPLIQMCMCIEQYLAVIHPVTFLRFKAIQYRIASAAAAWLIAVGNSSRLVSIKLNFFRDHVYFLVFCIAVITTSFCSVSVLSALVRPGPGDRNNVEMTEKDRNNKTDRGRAVENQQKRKAFRIISHILVSILICYFPLVVTYLMCIADIVSTHIFLCEVVPPILSITVITVLISPLFRMYSEGHLKHIMCFSKLRGYLSDTVFN